MTNTFSKRQMGVAATCALALGLVAGVARAETNPADTAYVTDQRGSVVKSNYGLCWHSNYGPPPVSTAECDPNFVQPPVAKVEAPPQPIAAVAVTPKPASVRLTLDADTLFDFDKALLRPAGREALDDFSGKLQGMDAEVITVVGHADRFGSEGYNQRLSEQRAAAVTNYLASKGVEQNRMQSEGKGETQPVTKAGECDGAKSVKVIACLQPDRRVEIDVVGSRIASK